MPRHAEQKDLPYPAHDLYALVADVDRYPEFLPWCVGARVYGRRGDVFYADLLIGFRTFRERFTSRVSLTPPGPDQEGRIAVDYIKGPLSYLHNDWRFHDNGDGTTRVDFVVDFAFKNRMFEIMVGGLFTEAVHRMVLAFEKRAEEVYGTPAP